MKKVKSSGLSVWRHHEEIVCTEGDRHDETLTAEINERMKRWKEEKERKKNEKKPCPFGCGKVWKNIHSLSVKEHILNKCPSRDGDDEKINNFFKKKGRAWITYSSSRKWNFIKNIFWTSFLWHLFLFNMFFCLTHLTNK